MTGVDARTRDARAPWIAMAAAAVVVLGLDLLTKTLVRSRILPGEIVDVLPGIDLTHTTNRGIAFGLFPDRQRIVAVFTAIVLCGVAVLLIRTTHRSMVGMIAAGALVGGAIGNLLDRLRRDGVTDFIDILSWPPFNIADIGVVVGAAVLALSLTTTRADEQPRTD